MPLHWSTVCALTGGETRFAALAGNMLDTPAARRGQTRSDHDRTDILGGFASLPPHPDGMPALQRLRSAGYRTVAFTNSSLDPVTRQITNAGIADHCDEIVSVEATDHRPGLDGYQALAHFYRLGGDAHRSTGGKYEFPLIPMRVHQRHGGLARPGRA